MGVQGKGVLSSLWGVYKPDRSGVNQRMLLNPPPEKQPPPVNILAPRFENRPKSPPNPCASPFSPGPIAYE